jgi:hypothetical protein
MNNEKVIIYKDYNIFVSNNVQEFFAVTFFQYGFRIAEKLIYLVKT